MSAPAPKRRTLRRRLLLFLAAAVVWTFLACYPNPAVFVRNLARYGDLPINPQLEEQMGWELPAEPVTIELFVDSLLVPTSDWRLYRVPWYVPRPVEAAAALHGDCEAKALVLASLLEGKGLPYELRASFNHIWVDYPGRPERPGEQAELAYLEGEPGKLRLHWPSRVEMRRFLRAQWEQLWVEMPLARKGILALGLVWAALAALLIGGALEGEFVSRWRPSPLVVHARGIWVSIGILIAVVLPYLRGGGAGLMRPTIFDLREVLALSLVAGGFLAWLSVLKPRLAASVEPETRAGAGRLRVESRLGLRRRAAEFEAGRLSHLELRASSGGLGPWTVFAGLRTGRLVPILRYREEQAARKALRELGRALDKPLLVKGRDESYRTMPDEIGLDVKRRAERRPRGSAAERSANCPLVAEREEGVWWLGYPRPEEDAVRMLLALVAACVGVAIVCTGLVFFFPHAVGVWAAWLAGAALLGMAVYAALVLREDVLAWLGRARIEVGDGEVRVNQTEEPGEAVRAEDVLSVETHWRREAPSLAVVTEDRVLHLRLACGREHLKWAREAVERAVIEEQEAPSAQSGGAPSPAT